MNTKRLKSFAKLNLYLKVFSPREDGLHPIKSIFQLVSLHDVLIIEKTKEKGIAISSQDKGLEQDNILIKVYEKYQAEIPFGVHITLEKNIPLGGGLGGGSSNAATFLSFLNEEAAWGLDQKGLMDRGAFFGSDIPYFFMGGTAIVEGVGNLISPHKPSPYTHFILINPNKHSDTAQVYRDVDQDGSLNKDSDATPDFGENDLKKVVFARIPELQKIEQFCLAEGIGTLYMSGSGATCFLAYHSPEKLNQDLLLLRDAFPNYFIISVS